MNRMVHSRPSLDEIEPNLFLGNLSSSTRYLTLQEHRISTLVSINTGCFEMWDRPYNRALVPKERHLFIPAFDSSTQDLLQHMTEACDFIERMCSLKIERPAKTKESKATPETQTSPNVNLVHCDVGISRSATIMIAYLMRKYCIPLKDAMTRVKAKRMKIRPNDGFREQLEIWEKTGYQVYEDGKAKTPKLEYKKFLKRRTKRLKKKGLTGNEPIVPESARIEAIFANMQLDE
ncbi:hypothetical protein SI65_00691 [Aspergillus cristatus]|uniref:Uncharacterized protein n=1 Tax=Aspergillus cristatus TaxID=573508 RepID=A0A1E3BQ63_ASPCR|nr:hypothetical protein SI65_00691 [Aspergillus cristatus]